MGVSLGRGLFVGWFALTGCVVYDETIVPRGSGSGGGGPSTVFGATWGVGSGGTGRADGAGGTAGHGEASVGDARDVENDDGWETAVDDAGSSPPRPTGIAVSGAIASPLAAPSTSGTTYARVCPRDTVVIGYTGTVNLPDASVNYLRSFQAVCGSLAVAGISTYAVEVLPNETLAQVGDTKGTLLQAVMCPPNQIVVGFGAHSGSFIDSLAFSCAPLEISEPDASSFELLVGAPTTMAAIGGPRGMTLTQVQCPEGTIAVGHAGKAGHDINSFGLLCGTPSLVFAGEP
jgi:hypothetical protein